MSAKKISVGIAIVLLVVALAVVVLHRPVTVESPAGAERGAGAPSRVETGGGDSPTVAEQREPPPGAAAEAQQMGGVFEFKVTAGPNDEPITRASVRLYRRADRSGSLGRTVWREPKTVETAQGGIARVPAEAGGYSVIVRAAGWAPLEVNDVQRPAGQALTRVDLKLVRGVAIAGFTADARSGAPVAPATVTLRRRTSPDAEARTTSVDAKGRFTFDEVAPGAWLLEGTAPGVGRASESVDVPRTDPVKLSFRPSGFVEGFVRLEDGGVAAGAKVLLVGLDAVEGEASSTGSFSIEAVSGDWRAQAYLGQLVGRSATDVTVRSGQTSSAGVIVLHGASSLSGRVLRGAVGVEGATVEVSPHNGDGLVATARSDAAGRYSVGLVGGIYDVEALIEGASAVVVHGVSVAKTTPLDLLVPELGRIEGRVVDSNDAPVSGATVELKRRVRQTHQSAMTSGDGAFAFEGLPPGMWDVRARAGRELGGAVALTKVVSAQTARVDLKLEAMSTLKGAVVWKCAGDARDLHLGLRPLAPNAAQALLPAQRELVPAASLQFEVSTRPGAYLLWAMTDDDQCAGQAEATTEPNKVSMVTLEVKPRSYSLEVSVREEDGQPAANAAVSIRQAATPGRMVLMSQADEEGVFRVDSASYGAPGPVVVTANKRGRTGRSAPVPPGTKSVVVTLTDPASSLAITIDGMAEGRSATVELSGTVFDSLVTTSPMLLLESVPEGRLSVSVVMGSRFAVGDVELTAGERGSLTVVLREGGSVKGRLVNAAGVPQAGVVVLVPEGPAAGNGSWRRSTLEVDRSGVFELSPVAVGSYLIFALGGAAPVPVTVGAGAPALVGDVVAEAPARPRP